MKKIVLLLSIPAIIQLILIPFWLLEPDYRYIDTSIISLALCLITPIYLFLIGLIFRGYKYGLIKIHVLMFIIMCSNIIFNRIGWSKLNMHSFMYPDPLTEGFQKSFFKFGLVMIIISFVVSYIVKLVKSR